MVAEPSDRKPSAENTTGRPRRGRDIFGTERELSDFLAHRTIIDQAKGMLMLVYDIDAGAAFDVLRKRSQETNVKVWHLAQQVLADLPSSVQSQSAELMAKCDRILLTVHKRVGRVEGTPFDDRAGF